MKTAIIEQFEDILKKYPDKCAIRQEDKDYSFRELGHLAALIKKRALAEDVRRKIIAVLLPKSIFLVSADVAIIAKGGAFMNLDCKLPMERMRAIISHVSPYIVITSEELKEKYKGVLSECKVFCVKEENLGSQEEFCLETDGIIDTDPFCVINTSGSTGTPKAVILNQRSFFDFVAWTDEVYGFDLKTCIGCLTPVYFDIYVFELCLLISKGATMVLLDSKYSTFPMELVAKLQKENINFIFWVPTIMVNIANQRLLDGIDLPELKYVWFAGEVFPTKQFVYWYDMLPQVQFSNLYGPIEITLDCTYYIITERPDEQEAIPIGYPCHNTDVLILNDDDKLCSSFEKGELCVRGSSLALGYYNDLEKTKKVFVQNPLNQMYPEIIYRTGDVVYRTDDGIIMFVGRKDSLIKHSGYRIELGEIEHILVNQCNLVKNCCAVYQKEKKEIILYYEAEAEIDKNVFYRELGKHVPKYMIPKIFIYRSELPQNPNGKIDRHKLEKEAME